VPARRTSCSADNSPSQTDHGAGPFAIRCRIPSRLTFRGGEACCIASRVPGRQSVGQPGRRRCAQAGCTARPNR
jgi:hypothetical protein